MSQTILITKRDGRVEPLDLNKLHKVVIEACGDLAGVSASEVELRAQLSFSNKMKTADIQETLIKAAADLISEEAPNYQYVAGRLINYHLRKGIYGQFEPIRLYDHIKKVVAAGFYDPLLLATYTEEEWDHIEKFVKHERDNTLTYAAMEQMRGKYLVKNRVTGQIMETPQMAYILIAAFLFHKYPAATRLKYVKDYYDAVSEFYISLPTPVMAGVRTPQRQFSSCVLIEADDDLNSIFTTAHAIGLYVSQKAGIGIGGGSLRPIGSPVRNGDTATTGVIPYFRVWQDAVKSCSQGGVRGGAATLYYPIWHMEIEDLLVLKDNKGTDITRLRGLDYGVQFNKLMYERLIEGGNITLFSPKDVPGLYDTFFADQEKFKELYEKAERNTRIRKISVPAFELFSKFQQQRKETGRIYLMNVDNANLQGSFQPCYAPVRMSNLCAEITLPTKPLFNINDPEGEIALCILSAINWGQIKHKEEFKQYANLAVRALDELIDIQSYPVEAARRSTVNRRSLGVGIINFAYWMAKNDLKYQDISPEGLALIDEWAEAWAFYLTEASIELAKEKGACGYFNDTKYAYGTTPNQNRKKAVDELVPYVERMPWEEQRQKLWMYGIRNSTLMALMPSETSSQIANATNGIEPVKALVTIKGSKDGILPQVVPEIRRLKNKYDLQHDQKSPKGYLKIMAVLQKYVDQAISVNTSYNPEFYENEEIPMSDMLEDLLLFYKYGGKNLYYFNTKDGAGEHDVAKHHEDAPTDYGDAECENCVI
jgi:ribonucleoside-diphosphate reductase alpha chain